MSDKTEQIRNELFRAVARSKSLDLTEKGWVHMSQREGKDCILASYVVRSYYLALDLQKEAEDFNSVGLSEYALLVSDFSDKIRNGAIFMEFLKEIYTNE